MFRSFIILIIACCFSACTLFADSPFSLKRMLLFASMPIVELNINASAESAEVGEEILFNAEINDALGNPTRCRYQWDFGDHSMGVREGRSIAHSFMRPGVYTVKLTVIGVDTRIVTTTITVTGEYIKLHPRPAAAPVVYYKFDDNLNDSSVNALHAAWSESGTFVNGAQEKAILTGIAGYVHAPDASHVIGGSSVLTVSFWARKTSAYSSGYMISYPGLFSLWMRDGGQCLMGQVITTNGTATAETWHMSATDTNWHHYVLSYDGSTIRIYFDGKECLTPGTCPVAQSGAVSTSGDHIYIGVNNPSGSPFRGEFDEIKIFESTLTPDELFIGFELWHADFHARTSQYLYARIPGEITMDASNTLAITITGDTGYSATLVNKSALQSVERVLLNNSSLPAGNYTLTATLRNASSTVLDTIREQFPKSYNGSPTVGIDENNAIRVNGNLFFPVTPFMLNIVDIPTWKTNSYISMLNSQGFPHDYTADGWDSYLNSSTSNGIKALGPGGSWGELIDGRYITGDGGRNSDIRIIDKYVNKSKNNPGLFAWIWRDEPDGGDEKIYLPAEVLRAWTKRTHALDPQHPVSINLLGEYLRDTYPSWAWTRSGFYQYLDNAGRFGRRTPVADMYSIDYYAIEFAATRGTTITSLCTVLDELRRRSYNLVPCMSFVETCDIDQAEGGMAHPTPWSPTPEQLRMVIWINVVHGMKGIEWFHYFGTTPAANYQVMSTFVDQITRLTPVVLGPEINPAVTVTVSDARIDTMVRQHDGKTYLFAVRVCNLDSSGNTIGSPVPATIHIDGVGTGTATVFDESRSLPVTSGSLQDTFNPAAVHIYVIE
ncbi:MAG: PKD domain-containing protein [Spirochaetes bacterium]|nr:PKD domain-containing protein [Spirochaetota bacterium]